MPVPTLDQRLLVLDATQLKKLRRQRGLTDAVGFRLAVGAGYRSFGFTIGFGNRLGSLGLSLRKLVTCTLRVLDRLSLGSDCCGDDLRNTRRTDKAELLDAYTDRFHLRLNHSLHLI